MRPAVTASSSVVERLATQGIRALVGAVSRRWVLVCFAPIYCITRLHRGGVRRERMGDPWVAFFLSSVLMISRSGEKIRKIRT